MLLLFSGCVYHSEDAEDVARLMLQLQGEVTCTGLPTRRSLVMQVVQVQVVMQGSTRRDISEAEEQEGGGEVNGQPADLAEGGDNTTTEYEVESVLGKRRGEIYYKVKWQGYDEDNLTWEPAINLGQEKIKEFEMGSKYTVVKKRNVQEEVTGRFKVDKLLAKKVCGIEYLVKLKGFFSLHNSWEEEGSLMKVLAAVRKFEDFKPRSGSVPCSSVGRKKVLKKPGPGSKIKRFEFVTMKTYAKKKEPEKVVKSQIWNCSCSTACLKGCGCRGARLQCGVGCGCQGSCSNSQVSRKVTVRDSLIPGAEHGCFATEDI